MHISEWMREVGCLTRSGRINYAEAARRLRLPDRSMARRYALGDEIPRPDRIAEIYCLTDGKVALADWYPEMPIRSRS